MEKGVNIFNRDFSFTREKDFVKKLLADKADFKSKDHKGRTVLHLLSTQYVHDESVGLFTETLLYALESGCSFTDQDEDGITPMHALTHGYTNAFFDFALEHGGAEAFNIKDKTGNTPLHWYGSNGRIEWWTKAVVNGGDPYIKNNNGLMTYQISPRGSLTAAGVRSFYKKVEKVLQKLPGGIPKPELIAPEAWTVPQPKQGEKWAVRGEQRFHAKGGFSYFGFYKVNDQYAIVTSEKFYFGIQLETGAVLWKQERFHLDTIDHAISFGDIWYAGVSDSGSGNSYVIAIDPKEGFTGISQEPKFMTLVGGWSAFASYSSSEFWAAGEYVLINVSSSVAILNAKTGKLVKGKPSGHSSKAVPFIWNNRVYSQCIVRKKPILTGMDITNGVPVEGSTIELKHIMAVEGNGYSFEKPVVHNDKLFYMAMTGELAVIDMPSGKTVFEQMLPSDRDYHPNVECFRMIGDVLHIFEASQCFLFDTVKLEFVKGVDYAFKKDMDYNFIEMTEDKLYVSSDDATELYDRHTGQLIQQIDLLYRTKVTSEGVLYMCTTDGDDVELMVVY